jgi:hypothetical protein
MGWIIVSCIASHCFQKATRKPQLPIMKDTSESIEWLKLDKQDYKFLQSKGDTDMDKDFEDAMDAIKMFVNSQVTEAEKMLRAKYGKSLMHTHATSVLASLKAMMTVSGPLR